MKALILNGSYEGDAAMDGISGAVKDELENAGWEVNSIVLHELNMADCLGCFKCWTKSPGICVIDDSGRDVAGMTARSDLLVCLTPVVFGGYSPELKKALDRMIGLLSPFFVKIKGEVRHRRRYKQYPGFMGIGVAARRDEESELIFRTLVSRNAINFHSPSQAATVLLRGQHPGETRDEIKALLRKVSKGK